MSLFVLAETPAGYGLFKSSDKKLLKRDDLSSTAGGITELLTLKKFVKFDSAANALEETASVKEGKVPSMLAKLLEDVKAERKASLAVADKALGNAISKLLADFNVTTVSDSSTMEVFRSIRGHLAELIPGLSAENVDRMALGLSHSMSRHKLRFSADKVDAMVIQAVKLLDDMDKELNVYAMRAKEWYGWHFPELAKILNDNLAYCRLVVSVGMRSNFAEADLTDLLPEELVDKVKAAAEISMGTEITEEDLENIKLLAEQVVTYTDYRIQLSSYLESRMRAIAPNATALVGFLVAARLVAHAGSLINLAKAPGSTIQILGAEKALFRALKTKHDTPKYGLIYHTSLVGQATGRTKGKIARMLAAKTALGLRYDALKEDPEDEDVDDEERALLGTGYRLSLERRLRVLEGKGPLPKGVNVAPNGDLITPAGFALKEGRKWNPETDGVAESAVNGKKKKPLIEELESKEVEMKDAEDEEDSDEEMNGASSPAPKAKKSKKDKKEKKEKKDKESKAESSTSASRLPTLTEAQYAEYAEQYGISVSKFKRKYERGDVALNEDGTPRVLSKRELKKMRKAQEAAEAAPAPAPTPIVAESSKKEKKDKKRKHEEEETEQPTKVKKHKKKRTSTD